MMVSITSSNKVDNKNGSQVIFLVGLVTMILMRTLRKDYARYSKEDEIDDMERDLGDEYGWKQVRVKCSLSQFFQLKF